MNPEFLESLSLHNISESHLGFLRTQTGKSTREFWKSNIPPDLRLWLCLLPGSLSHVFLVSFAEYCANSVSMLGTDARDNVRRLSDSAAEHAACAAYARTYKQVLLHATEASAAAIKAKGTEDETVLEQANWLAKRGFPEFRFLSRVEERDVNCFLHRAQVEAEFSNWMRAAKPGSLRELWSMEMPAVTRVMFVSSRGVLTSHELCVFATFCTEEARRSIHSLYSERDELARQTVRDEATYEYMYALQRMATQAYTKYAELYAMISISLVDILRVVKLTTQLARRPFDKGEGEAESYNRMAEWLVNNFTPEWSQRGGD